MKNIFGSALQICLFGESHGCLLYTSDQEVVIIENLTNLRQLGEELFTFCALPLKYCGADGAPVRAVGLQENGSQGHR